MKKTTFNFFLGTILMFSSGAFSQNVESRPSVQDSKWQKGGLYEGFIPNQEVLEKRTAISKHFKNADGSYTAQIGNLVHYKDASGAWQDIDYSITLNSRAEKNSYKFSNETNEVKSFFPEKAGTKTVSMEINENLNFNWWQNPKLEFKKDGIVLSSNSAKGQEGKLKNNTIVYDNVYPEISEEFVILPKGMENNTILHSLNNQIKGLPSGTILEFSQVIELKQGWNVISNGKVMSKNFDAVKFNIEIPGLDEGLHFSPIIVFDNTIVKEEALYLTNVPKDKLSANDLEKLKNHVFVADYSAEFTENGLKITTKLPIEWLRAAERSFPVTIDPTVTIGETTSGNFYGPMTHWYGYQRHANLYLQSEIGNYGSISAIEYFKTTNGSDRTKPAKIFMRTTENATLAGGQAWNSTTYTGGLTPLFDGNTTQNTGTGWVMIELTSPFEYTTGNLMIMVNDTYGGSGSVQYMSQLGSTIPPSRQTYNRTDNTDSGDGANMSLENRLQTIRITYNALGTREFETSKFIHYPNPVKNTLNLTYDHDISNITVHNLLGQQVLSKSVNANQTAIDMSVLPQGTYLVKATIDNTVKTIKVIKE